ncbi:cyclic nucleotide-binding domain protein (macronuclear) [Tetrahymena thermophila SB210]|uniref:Cyclic nucleotide-binding domain protein n=1 Tax=Tetrahymena thermophila (strain SB210) TaxID=312017 RepID=I7MB83_TETTS|nr:cyclic nucleotide-binding domain protein [Tetrahymena thermophila SB210]EAS07844.2 cyclic nucleotide-binding domain protein [Tetrahymena thermophila SB210]|eukprot:XP_001028086.2 cyclic nucleotide-binding domain protein [Tetrahymena thermophila SB210]
MTTIGYGDITPANAAESLFVTVIMIFMSCVFAYSINNIGLILQEIEKDSKELNDKLSIIHKFMEMKGVNLELQRRVKHYLHFLSQESKDRNKQEEDIILQMLSNKLRDEVLKEINFKVIQQIGCLSNCFSQKVIQELIFIIEEILVQPNQIIFKEGEIDEDQCMYFIWNGKVDIFYSDISKQKLNNSKTLTTLEANQTFGEISFFSGFARSASARSVNLATLYKISRVKFQKILSHHLGDFEKFKMIEEQIKSQDNLSAIQLECYNSSFNNDKRFNKLIVLISQLIQLVEINIQISKKLKQQAVYLGSKVFKMFEKNSIESQSDQEGEQTITKKKNLDDLSSDSSQSSSNSRESQSQTSINNIKTSQKKQKQTQNKKNKSIPDKKPSIENHNSKLIDHDQCKVAAPIEQNQKSSVNLNEIQIEKQLSNIQNNEKNNQRQSQQLSIENKSQDKITSNSINQSTELVVNHREGISDRKISQQASIQQSSMQLNLLCSSLVNIVKQQEIQIQNLNQQRQNQKKSMNSSKVLDQFCDPNVQAQAAIQKNILNEFDKAKNFLHFFPHNNLRTVLKQVKIAQQKKNNINIKNKNAQQPRRRQNVNLAQSIFDKKTKIVIENQDLIEYLNRSKPTFCSYGFYIKNVALHPLRASQSTLS